MLLLPQHSLSGTIRHGHGHTIIRGTRLIIGDSIHSIIPIRGIARISTILYGIRQALIGDTVAFRTIMAGITTQYTQIL